MIYWIQEATEAGAQGAGSSPSLLQSLLSGAFGALLVFVLGVVREICRRDRESVGLARLLRGEITHNEEVVRSAEEDESRVEQISSPRLSLMKTETWRATRTRTVQLVPSKLLTALEDYYVPLETLLTMLRYEEAKRKTTGNKEARPNVAGDEEHRARVASAGERWLRSALREAFGDEAKLNRATEYAEKAIDAQKEARKRLDEYLARPPWCQRWFGG
jgi:hypothetical protein